MSCFSSLLSHFIQPFLKENVPPHRDSNKTTIRITIIFRKLHYGFYKSLCVCVTTVAITVNFLPCKCNHLILWTETRQRLHRNIWTFLCALFGQNAVHIYKQQESGMWSQETHENAWWGDENTPTEIWLLLIRSSETHASRRHLKGTSGV